MKQESLNMLAEFVAKLKLTDLDANTIQHAKKVIRDTIAVIIAGSHEPQISNLYELVRRNGSPQEATVFGRTDRVPCSFAAMVNAAAGSTKEFEEGNSLVFGHPAIQIVPSAIAVGETVSGAGRTVIEGLVVGYEIAGRISRASKMRDGFHPSGTWGTIGAAVATAKVVGFSADEIAKVLNIASSFAISSNIENSFLGENISEMYTALSNYFGILSYHLFRCGFSAAPDNLIVTFGKLVSENFDEGVLLRDLGRKFLINKNYFKMYPSCRFSHSALEATEKILGRTQVKPETVESIEIRTYSQALHLENKDPRNVNAVRFSLPFLVAIALIRGKIDDEGIISYNDHISDIRALSERVTIIEEKSYNVDSMKRPAYVKIHLTNGETLESFVNNCRGGNDSPFTEEELREKFRNLSRGVIGQERCEKAIGLLENLENLDDIRDITELLRTG
ncbi:MAG: MmgE/PrpD family protein [Deltaproteobacteria bacterium]|nr:MmgE/PrpD family protein [Deltaproteobacteria bacterium]MBW2044752.1 MmgE/PrpD family protein [Deltaproteobacteria bacterium]MBW2301715.1 MmgE/PrpD family protein [Deltaproteobacteria bacterium]